MAFKGGTSLSKVFGAIARFSEDVDITLDYRGLDSHVDPFAEAVSNSQLKKFSDALKSFVRDHVHGVFAPHFQARLVAEFGAENGRLEVSDNGEQLRMQYPSVLETPGDYVGNSVLIEFGGRNIIEPNEEHDVRPDIAAYLLELDFPRSRVGIEPEVRARGSYQRAGEIITKSNTKIQIAMHRSGWLKRELAPTDIWNAALDGGGRVLRMTGSSRIPAALEITSLRPISAISGRW